MSRKFWCRCRSRLWIAVTATTLLLLLDKSVKRDHHVIADMDRERCYHPARQTRQTTDVKSATPFRRVEGKVTGHNENEAKITEDTFSKRRTHYQDVCRTHAPIGGTVSDPYVHMPSRLSMCLVPKVGCTFWKRVFFHLNGDTGRGPGQVSSPLDIDRLYVHFGGNRAPKTLSLHKEPEHDLIFNTTRVMFARDPWSRVWSAFVDKFVLPDSWLDHGQAIVRLRHQLRGSANENIASVSSTSPVQRFVCADDVTFSEFLHYALHVSFDSHWSPVHELCDPCTFWPHAVGKMETFARDARHVLVASGLGDLLGDEQQEHAGHVQDEVKLLTRYHFRMFERRPLLRACLDYVGVARRLWLAFQMNGYIAQSSTFPAECLGQALLGTTAAQASALVTSHVTAAAANSSLDQTQWASIRRQHVVAAYRSVPKELLVSMQERFALDFNLFQYDRQPPDIFCP